MGISINISFSKSTDNLGEVDYDRRQWTRRKNSSFTNHPYKNMDFDHLHIDVPTRELMSEKEFKEFCQNRNN